VEHWLFGLSVSSGRLVQPLAAGKPVRGARRPSTLLGPEGTAVRPLLYTDRDLLIYRVSKDRDRPYLENCTVDASIICSCQVDKGTR
jgi:hypothetical protein